MRCQKVRSYLSAYCRGELDGRRKLSIDEHLAECAECRHEEAVYLSINEASTKLTEIKVSADFNNSLLNRIAHERFAETRTNAYLPKEAPMFAWNKLVPAVASAAVVLLVAMSLFIGSNGENRGQLGFAENTTNELDYLTVQPTNNPNMTVNADKDWSFNRQMARSQRISNISNNIRPVSSFGSSETSMVRSASVDQIPFSSSYYRVTPVIRIYISTPSSSTQEASKVY